jgi:chromosome segregation ATPase
VNPWLTAALGLASLLMGGGGLAVLVNAFTGHRTRKAEVADRLSDSSLKWVEQFQEEAQRARLEAAEARREVAEVRRELAECLHQAEALAQDLRNLRGAIMSPTATLERLRAMVGGGDNFNGRP